MAKLTTDEQITKYEAIIERKEAILEEQEAYLEMEGQGVGATRVRYTNPEILEQQIQRYKNKVANLRMREDATI